jgi:hypothetical protein
MSRTTRTGVASGFVLGLSVYLLSVSSVLSREDRLAAHPQAFDVREEEQVIRRDNIRGDGRQGIVVPKLDLLLRSSAPKGDRRR